MSLKSYSPPNSSEMDDLWKSVTLENLQGVWIAPRGWGEIVISGNYACYYNKTNGMKNEVYPVTITDQSEKGLCPLVDLGTLLYIAKVTDTYFLDAVLGVRWHKQFSFCDDK